MMAEIILLSWECAADRHGDCRWWGAAMTVDMRSNSQAVLRVTAEGGCECVCHEITIDKARELLREGLTSESYARLAAEVSVSEPDLNPAGLNAPVGRCAISGHGRPHPLSKQCIAWRELPLMPDAPPTR